MLLSSVSTGAWGGEAGRTGLVFCWVLPWGLRSDLPLCTEQPSLESLGSLCQGPLRTAPHTLPERVKTYVNALLSTLGAHTLTVG